MRQILIDYARSRATERRDAGALQVTLQPGMVIAQPSQSVELDRLGLAAHERLR